MKTNSLFKLKSLLNKPSFTSKEAMTKGVHPSLLTYYANRGFIEKISRGIYKGRNQDNNSDIPFEWEDLVTTVISIPKGIICLVLALSLYKLTNEIPRAHWIAISNDTRAPKRPKTRIIRMREVKTGATKIKLGNVLVNIFDRERTIIDTFRYLSKETALAALKEYLKNKKQKPNLKKLVGYSRKLRTPISSYLEALTA